jgi:hypothetical protein
MPDLYDTALFGAMLLALVFAFLLLPFALWIFVRPILSRVRRFQFEQDGTVRGSFELSEPAPSLVERIKAAAERDSP